MTAPRLDLRGADSAETPHPAGFDEILKAFIRGRAVERLPAMASRAVLVVFFLAWFDYEFMAFFRLVFVASLCEIGDRNV